MGWEGSDGGETAISGRAGTHRCPSWRSSCCIRFSMAVTELWIASTRVHTFSTAVTLCFSVSSADFIPESWVECRRSSERSLLVLADSLATRACTSLNAASTAGVSPFAAITPAWPPAKTAAVGGTGEEEGEEDGAASAGDALVATGASTAARADPVGAATTAAAAADEEDEDEAEEEAEEDGNPSEVTVGGVFRLNGPVDIREESPIGWVSPVEEEDGKPVLSLLPAPESGRPIGGPVEGLRRPDASACWGDATAPSDCLRESLLHASRLAVSAASPARTWAASSATRVGSSTLVSAESRPDLPATRST